MSHHFQEFDPNLPLILEGKETLADWVSEEVTLNERFPWDGNAWSWEEGNFKESLLDENSVKTNDSEKIFFAMLKEKVPKLADNLSAADLVKYYLSYCWVESFKQPELIAVFIEKLQQKICEEKKSELDQNFESKSKKKLVQHLMHQIEKNRSLEQKTVQYYQLAQQAEQPHFAYYDPSEVLFHHHQDAVMRYEYEAMIETIETLINQNPADKDSNIKKLAKQTLELTQQYYAYLQGGLSLFGHHPIIAMQHRIAALIQIKEMLQHKTTQRVLFSVERPTITQFQGVDDTNLYVLVRPQNEFWHVDRSTQTPVLTQLPLNESQSDNFYHMFCGAVGDQLCEANEHDKVAIAWFNRGKFDSKSITQPKNPHRSHPLIGVTLELDEEAARSIPEYLLSDMKIYRHLMEDRTYVETSDQLLELFDRYEENNERINKHRAIYQNLEIIAADRLKLNADSRGIVPPAQRKKIMEMLIARLERPESLEAKHYFRRTHPIYLRNDFTPSEPIEETDQGAFVWDRSQNKLYYGNLQAQWIEVENITYQLKTKLDQLFPTDSSTCETTISVEDVYDLMTRPRLFSYGSYGLPYGITPYWFDYTYGIPLQLNRDKGLHTETAYEKIKDIHTQKLSITTHIYKFLEIMLFLVIPVILTSLGIVTIPLPVAILGVLGVAIVGWIFFAWDIQVGYDYLIHTLYMNDIAQPELSNLDSTLMDMNELEQRVNQVNEMVATLTNSGVPPKATRLFPPVSG